MNFNKSEDLGQLKTQSERTLMAAIISLPPVISGSYVNRPLDVGRATEAIRTPARFKIADSMWWTQDAHVIPSICHIITCHYMSYDITCHMISRHIITRNPMSHDYMISHVTWYHNHMIAHVTCYHMSHGITCYQMSHDYILSHVICYHMSHDYMLSHVILCQHVITCYHMSHDHMLSHVIQCHMITCYHML